MRQIEAERRGIAVMDDPAAFDRYERETNAKSETDGMIKVP